MTPPIAFTCPLPWRAAHLLNLLRFAFATFLWSLSRLLHCNPCDGVYSSPHVNEPL